MRAQLIALTLATIWALVFVINRPPQRGTLTPPTVTVVSFHKTLRDCKREVRKSSFSTPPGTTFFVSCEKYTVTERDFPRGIEP